MRIALGKGATSEELGLVATFPASAAPAVVITLSKTTADCSPPDQLR